MSGKRAGQMASQPVNSWSESARELRATESVQVAVAGQDAQDIIHQATGLDNGGAFIMSNSCRLW